MPGPSKYSPKVVKVLELWSKTPFLWVGLPRQQTTAKPESLLKTGGLSKYYQNHYYVFFEFGYEHICQEINGNELHIMKYLDKYLK